MRKSLLIFLILILKYTSVHLEAQVGILNQKDINQIETNCHVHFCDVYFDDNMDGILDLNEVRSEGLQEMNFHSKSDKGYFYIFSDRCEKVIINFLKTSNKSVVRSFGPYKTCKDRFEIVTVSKSLQPGEYVVQFLFLDSKIDCSYYLFWNMPLEKVNKFIFIPPKKLKDYEVPNL